MQPLLTGAIGLAFIFVCTVAEQVQGQNNRATFTVGTAAAARGQKATGTIEVPAGSDAALSIPVAILHGAKPGPVLASGNDSSQPATDQLHESAAVAPLRVDQALDRLAQT